MISPNQLVYTRNVNILNKFDSNNTANQLVLYKPGYVSPYDTTATIRYYGFLQSLRVRIDISSIEESDIPNLEPESTRAERLAAVREMEWLSKRKELEILVRNHEMPWLELFRISLLNRRPYYIVNLLPYFTEGSDFLMGNTLQVAARIKNAGYGLLSDNDTVTIFGGVQEQAWYLDPNSQPMVTNSNSTTYNNCTNYAFPPVTDVSSVILEENTNRKYTMLINNGVNRVWVGQGEVATAGEGIFIEPGGHYEITSNNTYTGALSVVCNSGESSNLTGVECV